MYIERETRDFGRLKVLVLLSSMLAASCLLSSCGPGPELIERGAPTDAYKSEKWSVCSVVGVRRVPGGLECMVDGDRRAKNGPYGGFKFPASGAKGLSLDLLFTTTNSILAAYVDGYNSNGVRVFRFQSRDKRKLSSEPRRYVFKPGQPVEGFLEVPSKGTGPVETFHVFVRIKPDSQASFEVANVERCN